MTFSQTVHPETIGGVFQPRFNAFDGPSVNGSKNDFFLQWQDLAANCNVAEDFCPPNLCRGDLKVFARFKTPPFFIPFIRFDSLSI
jgi:hypothetical protein